MPRTAKVFGFSLSPELYQTVENELAASHKTRSEFMRQAIDAYFTKQEGSQVIQQLTPTPAVVINQPINSQSTETILKAYYELIAADKNPTLIIGLAVIAKEGRVVIGQRKETDDLVKELTWAFPGGKFTSLNFDQELQAKVLTETGLIVYVNRLIHARLIPDSPEKKMRIIALYYHCTPVSGVETSGGSLNRLEWIDPAKICRYFTTSIADEVVEFLGTI